MSVAGQSFRLYLLSPHIRLNLSDRPYSKQSVWTMARAVSVRWEEDSDGGHWKCMQMWHFFTHLHTWPSHQTVYLFIYLPQIFIGVIIIIRVVVCDIYHQFILSAHASAKILGLVIVKLIRIRVSMFVSFVSWKKSFWKWIQRYCSSVAFIIIAVVWILLFFNIENYF